MNEYRFDELDELSTLFTPISWWRIILTVRLNWTVFC